MRRSATFSEDLNPSTAVRDRPRGHLVLRKCRPDVYFHRSKNVTWWTFTSLGSVLMRSVVELALASTSFAILCDAWGFRGDRRPLTVHASEAGEPNVSLVTINASPRTTEATSRQSENSLNGSRLAPMLYVHLCAALVFLSTTRVYRLNSGLVSRSIGRSLSISTGTGRSTSLPRSVAVVRPLRVFSPMLALRPEIGVGTTGQRGLSGRVASLARTLPFQSPMTIKWSSWRRSAIRLAYLNTGWSWLVRSADHSRRMRPCITSMATTTTTELKTCNYAAIGMGLALCSCAPTVVPTTLRRRLSRIEGC